MVAPSLPCGGHGYPTNSSPFFGRPGTIPAGWCARMASATSPADPWRELLVVSGFGAGLRHRTLCRMVKTRHGLGAWCSSAEPPARFPLTFLLPVPNVAASGSLPCDISRGRFVSANRPRLLGLQPLPHCLFLMRPVPPPLLHIPQQARQTVPHPCKIPSAAHIHP